MSDMTGAVRVRLAEYRKEKGLTQRQLAERAQVSRQTVIKLESGQFGAIESETLAKISDVVGDLSWLEYTLETKDEVS